MNERRHVELDPMVTGRTNGWYVVVVFALAILAMALAG